MPRCLSMPPPHGLRAFSIASSPSRRPPCLSPRARFDPELSLSARSPSFLDRVIPSRLPPCLFPEHDTIPSTLRLFLSQSRCPCRGVCGLFDSSRGFFDCWWAPLEDAKKTQCSWVSSWELALFVGAADAWRSWQGPRPSGKSLARSLARRWRGARKFLAAMRLRHAEASTAAAIMRARALVKLLGSTQSSNACRLRANLGSTWAARWRNFGVDLG